MPAFSSLDHVQQRLHVCGFASDSANKQLNFVQHVKTLLAIDGRRRRGRPLRGGAGETVRRTLLQDARVGARCDGASESRPDSSVQRWQRADHPENDARPWIRFSLTAHLRQAKTLLARVKESEELWERCVVEAQSARLPSRVVPVLFNTALGFRAQRSLYRSLVEEDVSEAMATRDLRAMADAGLLVAHGERRGRFYTASEELRTIAVEIRGRRPRLDDSDPFARNPTSDTVSLA